MTASQFSSFCVGSLLYAGRPKRKTRENNSQKCSEHFDLETFSARIFIYKRAKKRMTYILLIEQQKRLSSPFPRPLLKMLIVLFFRDSRSRGTISPASTASEDFGHYVKRFRVWLSPLPESYYDDSPLFISGGIHQKEAEDKGGGGGHLPHFTDFGSFSSFAGSCGRERLMELRSLFFSIYFWRRCWGALLVTPPNVKWEIIQKTQG